MQKVTITIPLDADTARAYESAAPTEKRKIEALLSLWMRELAAGNMPRCKACWMKSAERPRLAGLLRTPWTRY